MNFDYNDYAVVKEPYEDIDKVRMWADNFAEFLSKITKYGVVVTSIRGGISAYMYYIEYDVVGIADFSMRIDIREPLQKNISKVNLIKDFVNRHVC